MYARVRLAAVLVLAAGTVLGAGQTPAPGPGQTPPPSDQTPTPTFKAEVEYVEVDALVTDQQGRFVRDLKKEDFQVFEDGRRQTISTFSLVDIPREPPDRPLFSSVPIEPDVKSNERPFDGRVYVMVLDDLHTDALRSQYVKRAARQFIERNLAANDLMAVVHTGGRSDSSQEFTSNKRLLLASVDKFMGRKLQSATLARNEEYFRQAGTPFRGSVADPYDQERGFNAQSTLSTLRQVAEWFGGVRGRRKTMLFISEGIDYDITDVIRQMDAPSSAASMIIDDIREAISATARSNVSIYSIDPRGLTMLGDDAIGVSGWADANPPPADDTGSGGGGASGRPGIGPGSLRNELQLSQDSLRALAEESGGFAAVNTNEFGTAFDRIVSDNSSYYVLAYYPPSPKRDGKFHRIQVRVSRPGVTVRARRGYASPKGKPPAPRATTNDGASPALLEALNSPLQVSGLRTRLFAAPFKGTAPNASVLIGIEMVGRDLQLAANSRIELSFLAIDQKGKVFGGKTDRITLNLRPETRARVEQSALRALRRMDLPPGSYQVRVAARDEAGGLVGSVIQDLEVPDFAKLPFSMSGIALTSMASSTAVTVQPDQQLRDVLPAPPGALRTFAQNDEIALFAEVYDNAGNIPHGVDITTSITSDEGTVVYKAEEQRSSTELQGRSGGYGYTARIPLTDLAPGPYVLTVEARSRLSGNPTTTRHIRFDVVRAAER
jgi:VWFA-related protein